MMQIPRSSHRNANPGVIINNGSGGAWRQNDPSPRPNLNVEPMPTEGTIHGPFLAPETETARKEISARTIKKEREHASSTRLKRYRCVEHNRFACEPCGYAHHAAIIAEQEDWADEEEPVTIVPAHVVEELPRVVTTAPTIAAVGKAKAAPDLEERRRLSVERDAAEELAKEYWVNEHRARQAARDAKAAAEGRNRPRSEPSNLPQWSSWTVVGERHRTRVVG